MPASRAHVERGHGVAAHGRPGQHDDDRGRVGHRDAGPAGRLPAHDRDSACCASRASGTPVARTRSAPPGSSDEAFDLDAHLVRVALPAPAGKARVAGAGRRLASEPLDPRRPMWQVHLVERYERRQRVDHARAPLLRGRHRDDPRAAVMTEQDSGRALGAAAAPAQARAHGRRRRAARARAGSSSWRSRRATSSRTRSPRARGCSRAASTSCSTRGGRRRSPAGRAAWRASSPGCSRCPTIPSRRCAAPERREDRRLGDADPAAGGQDVGKALGCSINDVLMATVAGALGGHLRDAGLRHARPAVRASVPVNLRAAEEPLTLGNKFGLVFVELALGTRQPAAAPLRDARGDGGAQGLAAAADDADVARAHGHDAGRAAGAGDRDCSAARRPPSSRTCRARRRRSTCAGSASRKCTSGCRRAARSASGSASCPTPARCTSG